MRGVTLRALLLLVPIAAVSRAGQRPAAAVSQLPPRSPPNVIVILTTISATAISAATHPTIRTPHLNRMAAEGQVGGFPCLLVDARFTVLPGVWTSMGSNPSRILNGPYWPSSAGSNL
jgi:hypothetical protein